ncbi:MAG: tetratricopeptide repeat protein [Candidatus Omnitrophica bacterium]|nr:tetratricopeptide repeat protein [Candidatus Omnitrophota bacterium]
MRKEPGVKNSRKKEDLDYEITFYEGVLQNAPDFVEALSAIGDLYTRAGLWQKGLEVDIKLSQLRSEDPIVFYNLACSYCLLHQPALALSYLTRAIDLGYDDFEYLKGDCDLDNLLKDGHFQKHIKQLEKKKKLASKA